MGVEKDGKDQLERHGTGRKKSYGCDLEKEEKLNRSVFRKTCVFLTYSEVRSDDGRKTKGKKTIGYAE